jgi:UDP-N-acetylglucosamine 1-carboxyvinyltransferase
LREDGSIFIDSSKLTNLTAEYSLVKTMRASILTLGPMLTKYKKAKISLPGGCAIGTRPVNLHLEALEKMGATIEVKNGYIHAKTKELVGAQINFDLISVTATENIIMAASLAKGITTINNAAQEPEVTDLIRCLNKMGAKISGENTSTLVIEGVNHLNGVKYSICPDRIEAGTYLVAAAITGGKITVNNIEPDTMRAVIGKLIETGADIQTNQNSIKLDMKGKRPYPVNIRTSAYPNFPTDMQAQFLALNSIAEGSSTITETIFENRFMHVPELSRMGANLKLEGNTVVCKGVKSLSGANLMAKLRNMHKAIFKDSLSNSATSICNRIQCHELSLHICWKVWVSTRSNINRIRSFSFHIELNRVLIGLNVRSRFNKFTNNSSHSIWLNIINCNFSTCYRCSNKIGARLDSIWTN